MSDKVLSNTVSNRSSNKDESNDDVYVPPENHVSDPSSSQENKQLGITFTKMSDDDMLIIKQFTFLFKTLTFSGNVKWNTKITHLIIKTESNNRCNHRFHKFLHALLTNCFIVNLEWVRQSLNSKTLLREVDFMPFDITGDDSPLTVWRVRQGIIYSPMDWAKNCIIYFHTTTKCNFMFTNWHAWAIQAGFVLANEMEELNDEKYGMRVILVNSPNRSMQSSYKKLYPTQVQIMEWAVEYNAMVLYIDWFLECLFRFKFVTFQPQYLVNNLNNALMKSSDLKKFAIQLD